MSVSPRPDTEDQAIHSMAQRVMGVCDPSGYSLDHSWSDEAGMWFVEIAPIGSSAAPISLCKGGDTLNIYFGATRFEYSPFEMSDVPEVEQVLESIRDGEFVQAGSVSRSRTFARIYVRGETWNVGHAHIWPWKWRNTAHFEPYPRKREDSPFT